MGERHRTGDTGRRTCARAVAVAVACAVAAPAHTAPSAAAAAYLDDALDLMETHSLHRATIDWAGLRSAVYDAAGDAQATRDTYPALRVGLTLLGDNHSALIPPAGPAPTAHDAAVAAVSAYPSARLIGGMVGYLHVPGHRGGSAAADRDYADALQALISRVDEAAPCAWIVDLRDNPGGNMWPMLAGLQPLLGSGDVGAFEDATGEATRWWVDAGAAGAGDATQAASHYAYALRDGDAPVAVLTGPATASSGEAVAVAFRGRADARSFGARTLGVSTGNRGFVLADGAVLFVTASRFADRDGNVYGGVIEPDVSVPPAEAVDAALAWLHGRRTCVD